MRLFVAMDLSQGVRAAIEKFCERLRAACPAAKWVRTEGMHITLKFIGEANEPLLSQIPPALREIRSPDAAGMNFRGTGFFPSSKRPRVLWVGIEPSSNLSQIAADIETRFQKLGIPHEERGFKPHLTLARFETPRGLEALHRELQSADAIEFGSIRTGEFHLYRSESQRGGARYTRLETFRFVTGAAA